jgi:hypothetical protein
VSRPTTFTVQRAEAAYKRAEEERKRLEAKDEQDRVVAHARSMQTSQEAQRALSSPHRSLREALEWFRDEWTATHPPKLHEDGETSEPDDVLGAPAWTLRWKRWLSSVDPADPDVPMYDPLRRAHMSLTMSESLWDRSGAAFVFRLACCGFDPLAAARNMPDPLPVTYVAWYTEKAIDRLREVVARERTRQPGKVERPEWMDRLGIGKSEAQHHAEAA